MPKQTGGTAVVTLPELHTLQETEGPFARSRALEERLAKLDQLLEDVLAHFGRENLPDELAQRCAARKI